MHKNFQIYRASAGSGKTYTLCLNFISLALKGDKYGYENYYRKILAITFTNKAASEMKQRVLYYLFVLSKGQDVDKILIWLIEKTGFSQELIFARSSVIHKHILYNYSDLSILTIDKFTYKIVKTFSSDLGISHNFDLVMNDYKIIQPAVALLLDKISDNGDVLSNALVNFASQKIKEGKSINIERDLEDFAHQIFKQEIDQYTDNQFIKIDASMDVKQYLQKRKEDIILKLQNLSNTVCCFFISNGLSKEHFKRGVFYNHFTKKLKLDDDSKWRPTDTLLEDIENDNWYSQSVKQDIKDVVNSLKPSLVKFFSQLMILLNEYYSVKAVLRNIYVIGVLNELIQVIQEFKKENNIEQISGFNKKINSVVANEPALFIYERIGERYNHYLIDEFQDTSLLQWQNILPLITESLDFGPSMLVGDGKQSIYRWRGGEVEQFSNLPYIFKGDNLSFKRNWENKLKNHYITNNLKKNYRSRKNIIDFNNMFFEKSKELLSNDLKKIYDKLTQESIKSKEGGYVHIELFGNKSNDFKQLILRKIINEIKKITTCNNYNYKDITILCNTRKSVSIVAENLSANSIPVVSNEGLILAHSDKVHALIAILKYLKNQSDSIAKLIIVEYLWKSCLPNEDLHQIHLEIKSEKGFFQVLKRANVQLNKSLILETPLYQLIENVIRAFNFEDDIYVDFFLDLVLDYVHKEGSSLSGFLNWWEEIGDKEAIIIPEEIDAVKIMTIHQSKGLAFDVVIIPFNWEDRNKNFDLWVDTSNYFNKKLKTALISGSEELKVSFFKDNYQKEKEMSMLDTLNKLYVAMTRAKERLYVFSKSFPNTIKNYQQKQNLNSFLYHYSNSFPIILGDPEMTHESKETLKKNFLIKNHKNLNWEDVISLKHNAEAIWDTETVFTKRDWGKLLHFVLSKIKYFHQKDDVIDQMYSLGHFSNEDYEKLKREISILLNHPNVNQYFTDNWEVKNEKEILTSNGRSYIPDRLLFSKFSDKVVIIDYKTGKEEYQHKKQLIAYADTLMFMGKKNIERILLYTSDPIKLLRL